MTSPIQRSLALLRKEGWMVAITERWNQYAKVRQDLFGFIDLIAVKGDVILAVQTTTGDHAAERIAKIRATQAFDLWFHPPTREVEVHGWRKVGARGKRKTWQCRRIVVCRGATVGITPDTLKSN